jgi:NADH-quinone oxidoreductase subunit J
MIEVIQIALLGLIVIFAILTVELSDLVYSIISFCLMSISLGALYWTFNAPYVAVFQILIYAGAVVALFIAAIMLTVRRGVR